jgi:hypothetical protein
MSRLTVLILLIENKRFPGEMEKSRDRRNFSPRRPSWGKMAAGATIFVSPLREKITLAPIGL